VRVRKEAATSHRSKDKTLTTRALITMRQLVVRSRELTVVTVMQSGHRSREKLQPQSRSLRPLQATSQHKRSSTTVSQNFRSQPKLASAQRTLTRSTRIRTWSCHTWVSTAGRISSQFATAMVSSVKKYLNLSRRAWDSTLSQELRQPLTKLKSPKELSIQRKLKSS